MYFLNKKDSLDMMCGIVGLSCSNIDGHPHSGVANDKLKDITDTFTYRKDLTLNYEYPSSLPNFILEKVQGFDEAILFITQIGVFPSSENRHLYYRLRQSYGNYQPVYDQPGHVFYNFESEDLRTFIQIVTFNFWDAILITRPSYYFFEFSHDSIITAGSDNEELLKTDDFESWRNITVLR